MAFWKFGFGTNISTIESLLDKPDCTLEDLLDEDDLLQETRTHNTKLLEFLRDPVVLGKLLGYVVCEEGDEKQKFKYSYVSCEVLSCEVWSICEAVIENRELLEMFWTFLDRPAPLNPLLATYFTRVNEQFLEKKTEDMIPFIQSIPNIVEKMLQHIDTPPIMDLLLKIISMDKSEAGAGVVDWLHDSGLITKFMAKIDPHQPTDTQTIVADVLKAIIAISANADNQGVIGPNSLSRELVSEETVNKLVDYMLHPTAPNSTTCLTNGVSIVIECIRKNNSDYDQVNLVQLYENHRPATPRDPIYLGTMLAIFASKIPEFQGLLSTPKTVRDAIPTAFGEIKPLGFERFRICELYAELLHCSNMGLLNDPRADSIATKRDEEREEYIERRRRGSAVSAKRRWGGGDGDSDDELRVEFVEDENEEQERTRTPEAMSPVSSSGEGEQTQIEEVEVRSKGSASGSENGEGSASESEDEDEDDDSSTPRMSMDIGASASALQEFFSDDESEGEMKLQDPVVGDMLKMQFLEHAVLPTILDLFFEYPWNNFLHNVVYDVVQQVLLGSMPSGYARELAIDVFGRGRIIERIFEGQKRSDESKYRLGYMGHLFLIADEIVKLTERSPPETLPPIIAEKVTSKEWLEYVETVIVPTRARENTMLGGVRPPAPSIPGMTEGGMDNGVFEQMATDMAGMSMEGEEAVEGDEEGGRSGRFGGRLEDDDGDLGNDEFARYMSQQITNDLPDKFGSSDEDEDEDDIIGWTSNETGEFEPRGYHHQGLQPRGHGRPEDFEIESYYEDDDGEDPFGDPAVSLDVEEGIDIGDLEPEQIEEAEVEELQNSSDEEVFVDEAEEEVEGAARNTFSMPDVANVERLSEGVSAYDAHVARH
ncbi:sporulation-induced protein [Saitoella coloradoensis]